jgi:hypothetical protein
MCLKGIGVAAVAVIVVALTMYPEKTAHSTPQRFDKVVSQQDYDGAERINQKYGELRAAALDEFASGEPTAENTEKLKNKVKEAEEWRLRALAALNGQDYTPPPPPKPPQPAPPAPPPPAPKDPGVGNLEDYHVIKDGTSDGQWKFQLDARKIWQVTAATVSAGDELEFNATGQVCGGINLGCVGPNGQDGPAEGSHDNPGEFPFGKAFHQALIARIGSHVFQVGDHKTFTVPNDIGPGNCFVELMDNYRLPHIGKASGGFPVELTIRKK